MLAAWGCCIGFLLGFSFSFFSLFSQWVNSRVCGPPLSAAVANFLFKQSFPLTNYCSVVMREGFWFPLFSSLPASQKKSSLVSMMVVALMKIEHSSMFLTKHIVSPAAAGTSQSIFSLPLLFHSFLIHSNSQDHLQSCCSHFNRSLYFEASGCGEVRSSSGI